MAGAQTIALCGGGNVSVNRGAYVLAYGNEATTVGGEISINAGNVSTGEIYFYTQNNARTKITYSGNVLIGTQTDNGQKLQVNGTAKFDGTSGSPVTLTIGSSNSNCDITMQSSNSSSVSRIRNNTNDLQFHTNGTLALTLASNQAATFSSSIAIANTVTAAIAAPSTHKVSILINGVQYYLLASNV